jgi:hypothetical protein
VNTVVTSVSALQHSDGRQFVTTGALRVALKTDTRIIPYVIAGAGVASDSGNAMSVSLVGDYRFDLAGVLPVHETDSVTLRYTSADSGIVGVLGGGFKYALSPRVGWRLDARAQFVSNGINTTLDTKPVVSTLTPVGSAATLTSPGLQFGNDPSSGIRSNLTSPAIRGFQSLAAGIQRHVSVTMGLFWRF